MTVRKHIGWAMPLAMMFLWWAVPTVHAQSGGGLELKGSHVGAGTVEPLVGGGFSLRGTVGQAGAGIVIGGGFQLTGGFWVVTLAGGCGDTCQLYGDVVSEFCLVDVDDLLCVLDDFVNPANCAGDGDIYPCDPDGVSPFSHGDGINDVDDIIAVLGAFVGFASCPDPCPPP